MSPNLEGKSNEGPFENNDISLILTPLIRMNNFINENNGIFDGGVVLVDDEPDLSIHDEISQVPLDQNLRELLVRITNTEDLSTVTQLKLRVISRETTLQYLPIYTPALRELILDGSVVSSLRDLGNGLRNLKTLKVNRCGLTCIDGVFGFENLEELYAADNEITSLAGCAFLSYLKVLDVRRNKLKPFNISYLYLFGRLVDLSVDGNPELGDYHDYSIVIQDLLPTLKRLNGIALVTGAIEVSAAESQTSESRPSSNSESVTTSEDSSNSFSITFPPRVC